MSAKRRKARKFLKLYKKTFKYYLTVALANMFAQEQFFKMLIAKGKKNATR